MKNFFNTSTGIWNLRNALQYNYDGRIFVHFVKFDHLEYGLRSIKYESIEFMRKPESSTKQCWTNFNVMANGMKDLNCIPFQATIVISHFSNDVWIILLLLFNQNWRENKIDLKFSFRYSSYLFWHFLSPVK